MASIRQFLARPDVRRHRTRFLARRLRFELERRVRPSALARPRTVMLEGGGLLHVRLDDVVERAIYLYGTHEFYATEVFKALVQPGGVVVDAGAHVGQFTVIAARAAGPTGYVHAFEPSPETYVRLVANVEANGFENVSCEQVALGAVSGEALLRLSDDPANSGLAALGADGIRVQEIRLDEAIAGAVDVIKADVEGAEAELFAGAEQTLRASYPSIVFEVNDDAALDVLRGHGYELFGARPRAAAPGWELVLLRPDEDPAPFRERWSALNLVALHPTRQIRRQLPVA